MQILYHKTAPTFLSVGLLRFIMGIEFVFLLVVLFKLLTAGESEGIFALVAFLVVICIGILKDSAQYIAYLGEDEIVLKGVFEERVYKYSEFVRVSSRFRLYGIVCMEFSDGRKYNLVYKEISDNRYRNLFEDYKEIASDIELRVRIHFKRLSKVEVSS